MFRSKKSALSLILLWFLTTTAWADSLDMLNYYASLEVGETVTKPTTVTVNAQPAAPAPMDVMFLVDTTGSMSSVISAVKATAISIFNTLFGAGDVASGVAYFNDDAGTPSPNIETYTDITRPLSMFGTPNAAINALGTHGGSGASEGFLGISRTVTDTAWRTGSQRYLVMFGDTYNGGDTPFADDNAAAALAALQQQNVHLLGVNYNTQTPNSFASTYNAIAQSSGGSMYSYTGSNGNTIANAIASTIIQSSVLNPTFEAYNSVCLFAPSPAGVAVDLAPECISGDFDRSVTRTFDFDVNFTGVNVGDYNFLTRAIVGGLQVASQVNHITVTAPVVAVPEPGAMTLLGLVLAGLSLNGIGRRERAPVRAGARMA